MGGKDGTVYRRIWNWNFTSDSRRKCHKYVRHTYDLHIKERTSGVTMKEVISEYAGTVLALFGTGLLLTVVGSFLLTKGGMLSCLMELVLKGGV